MVSSQSLPDGITRITLMPNRSATWRQAKWLLLLMAVPVALVAIGWTLAGVWMVLPFAGLEFSLVAIFMYYVSRQTLRRQVITIEPYKVIVTQGLGHMERFAMLERPDAHLVVRDTGRDVDLPVLTLVDRFSTVHVGDFLNRNQRLELVRTLSKAGIVAVSNRWWDSATPPSTNHSSW